MIEILVVDDNVEKVSRLVELIDLILSECPHAIAHADTVTAASVALRAKKFDLLILDLMIPMRSDESPRQDGGVRLLELMLRPGPMQRPVHIVGLTEHDSLHAAHAQQFDKELWHLILYDRASSEWEVKLGAKLVHIVETRRQDAMHKTEIDLAIVTALHHVELENVLLLPAGWTQQTLTGDDAIYHCGTFERDKRRLTVVASAATEMGMTASAALATKIIYTFRPRYLAMVGIAAGVEGRFGDVLIASHSWDYGSGKVKEKKGKSLFEPAPSQLPSDPAIMAKLNLFRLKSYVPREIVSRWKDASEVPFEVRIGPLASGASVVANRNVIEEIVAHNRKLIGVEMEVYGVYMAARVAAAPRPLVFAIKSMCDYGDGSKGDQYQQYSGFTSAQYMYEFAMDQLSSS